MAEIFTDCKIIEFLSLFGFQMAEIYTDLPRLYTDNSISHNKRSHYDIFNIMLACIN